MKKLFIVSAIFIFCSCDNTANNTNEAGANTDSVGLTNPVVIDTLKHPSGMDNSSVISTDTAAMNVQNTINKADSIAKENKK
ncbi:MAG: hypothetical protein ABIN97_08255 [Ginsengibacter sp.]